MVSNSLFASPWAPKGSSLRRAAKHAKLKPKLAKPKPKLAEPKPKLAEPKPKLAEPKPKLAEPKPKLARQRKHEFASSKPNLPSVHRRKQAADPRCAKAKKALACATLQRIEERRSSRAAGGEVELPL